jgi:hypothetical protein
MLHRHLTLERYELALETDPVAAARLQAVASGCDVCRSALSKGPLGAALAAWSVAPGVEQGVNWESALQRAIAPRRAPASRPGGGAGWLRPVLLLACLAALLIGGAFPAAAAAPPKSPLFPVRGWTEQAQVGLTPGSERGKLESQFAASYLVDAQVSADNHDSAAYRASMDRFFYWADRLRGDVKLVPKADRSAIRANVTAAKALLPAIGAAAGEQGDVHRADEVLSNVQGQSQENDGDHQGG